MTYQGVKNWTNEPLVASDMDTYISDSIDGLKNPPSAVYNAAEASDLSLASTTWADMDATEGKLQHTITTTGTSSAVMIMFRATGSVAVGNNALFLDVAVDGVAQGVTTFGSADGLQGVAFTNGAGAVEGAFVFIHWVTGLAAGSHVFKMRYKVTTGANTITLYRGAAGVADITPQFIAREVS